LFFLGDFLVNKMVKYRGEASDSVATHPDAVVAGLDELNSAGRLAAETTNWVGALRLTGATV